MSDLRVYVNTGALTALDARTGKVVRSARTVTANSTSFVAPAVRSDMVYATGGDGRVHAVRARDGVEQWAAGRATNDTTALAPVAADGALYLPSGDSAVYVYRAAR